jgi:hypothetical protein
MAAMRISDILSIFGSQFWTFLKFTLVATTVALLFLYLGVPAITGTILLCDQPTASQRFVRSVTGAQFVGASCLEKPIDTADQSL